MNRFAILSAFIVLSAGCSSPHTEPQQCGVNNPIQDLPWLNEIVNKAEADKAKMAYKDNYIGTIYMDTYKNQSVFMVKMMDSGGLYTYLFECDDKRIAFTQEEVGTLFTDIEKPNNVLYTNAP